MRSESEMTHEDIIRMAEEAGIGNAFSLEKNQYVYRFGHGSVERFAALVAAAKQEHIASQWDALHEQYMADPLRRQMMLSYEMVANMIRGEK